MGEETGEFELNPGDIQPAPGTPSDAGDDATGGIDFGLDFPPVASPSQSPGIIGGGLRDEGFPTQGKQKKLSRHGIPVPNLPAGVVKKLASQFARTGAGSKTKINKAALAAIEQASSWYFEQVSQDLAAYSKHAGRKTIDESDVTTLMRRYEFVTPIPISCISLTFPGNVILIARQRFSPWLRSICPRSFNRI
jgi:histone H3/H4